MEKFSHRKIIFILLGISYAFLMMGNSIVSLTHPDEVFYAQTAKEMLERNNWLVPYIFDGPQFEKPILTFWLLMIAGKIFGMTAFAMRFWPAAFGMVGVLATYWLAWMMLESKRAAFLSALILSTSFIYLVLSRSVLTDMIFSIWVVLALVFFWHAYTNKAKKTVGIIWCFIFSALAILTKGALGIIFPALVAGAYLFYKKDFAFLKSRATLFGLGLFLLISLPWHIFVLKEFGQGFIDEYWKNVHVRRIFEAEHQKSNTWYFYLFTIFVGIFPWSVFLFPAGVSASGALKQRGKQRDAFIFLIFWIVLVTVLMQIAQSKLASYIFPVFPAVAVILGHYFDRLLSRERKNFPLGLTKTCGFLMALFLVGWGVGALIASNIYKDLIPNLAPAYVFFAFACVFSFLLFIFTWQQKFKRILIVLSGVTMLVLFIAYLGRSYAEPWVSCQGISEVLKKTDTGDSVVLCSKFYVRGIRFYTDRKTAVINNRDKGFFSPHPVPFLNTDDKIRSFLESQPTTYCIVRKNDLEEIEKVANGKFTITPIDEIGGKHLIVVKKR